MEVKWCWQRGEVEGTEPSLAASVFRTLEKREGVACWFTWS